MTNITIYYQSKDIVFFLGVGPMNQLYLNATLEAITLAKAQGLNVYYMNQYGPVRDGCNNHPGIKGHQQMFEMAQPLIASVLGWK